MKKILWIEDDFTRLKGMMRPLEKEGFQIKFAEDYPEFEKLRSFTIAVNAEYRSDDFVLSAQDEVVIIPPVSGG